MRLYQLGHVPWDHSQLIYHALPRLGMEGLILLSPASPYFCIGYHQDVSQEVDLDYCREQDIPVFRREVGGGAVYLDGHQLFYQLVLHRGHPLAGGDKAAFYQRTLAPVIATYRDLGIDVQYKPVNDIITTDGRKISGNGAGEIDDFVILVGNVILDFDYDTMARVLRVPDEKYRDKVHKSLRENLTTVRRELGSVPPEDEVNAILARHFSEILGPLEPTRLPEEVLRKVDELRPQFTSEDWLKGRSRRVMPDGRSLRIASGIDVLQRIRKTPGGLVRITLEVKDGLMESVAISGDFFFYPPHKLANLEESLRGVPLAEAEPAIQTFFSREEIESPGLTPADLASILQGAT